MAKKKASPAITFSAQIHSIRTTIDGGANVTFALNGNEVKALTQLLEIRNRTGVILEIAAVPVKPETHAQKETNTKNTSQRRKQRYPYRA